MDPLKQWVSDAAAAQFVEEQIQSLSELQRSRSQKLTIEIEQTQVQIDDDDDDDDGEHQDVEKKAEVVVAKTPTAHAAVEVCLQHLEIIGRALDRHVTSQSIAKPSITKASSSAWKSSSRKVAASDIALGGSSSVGVVPKEGMVVSQRFVRAMSSKKLHALSQDVAQLVDSHSEHIRQIQQIESDIDAAQRQKEEDSERADLANARRKKLAFSRNIHLCTEVLGVYFGRTCRTPIMSIERDESLLFDLLEPSREGRRVDPRLMRLRVMQIKVRINAIVNSIVSNELPEEVYDFMCSLLNDGNSIPDSFLFAFEKEQLTFNENQETVNMIPIIDDCDVKEAPPPPEERSALQQVFSRIGSIFYSLLPRRPKLAPETEPEPQGGTGFSRPSDIVSIGNGQSADARKVKMLIQNFIVIKVLINLVVLSPWGVGAAAVPKKTKRDWQTILRVVNNYRMVASIMYKLLRLLDPSLPKIEHRALPPGSPSQKGASNGGALSSSLTKRSLYDSSSPSKKDSSGSGKYEPDSPVRSEERKAAKFWVEESLIGRRRLFQPLEETMQLLLPEDPYYVHAQAHLDEWLGATAKKLGTWIAGLVSRMVRQKLRGCVPSPALSRQGSRPVTRDALERQQEEGRGGERQQQEEEAGATVSEREMLSEMVALEQQQQDDPHVIFEDTTLGSALAEISNKGK